MKHVSFEEYEAAKAEIIGGVHYIEKSTMENDVIHKTYSTEENGTFYEVNDKGRVEFWSDKHSESRIYDENERATETDKKAGTGYGDLLAERIRANKAGYDRKWKANHGIALTLEEFTAEAECRGRKLDTLQEVYRVISEHIKAGRLTAGALMDYAYYAWCLRELEAIIAYQIGTEKTRRFTRNGRSITVRRKSQKRKPALQFAKNSGSRLAGSASSGPRTTTRPTGISFGLTAPGGAG